MLPDRVSNPGPLTYESGALPINDEQSCMSLMESFFNLTYRSFSQNTRNGQNWS